MKPAMIQFKNVKKYYDDTVVLKKINLELEKGKFYTLLGPSGCGKTTILKILGGFSQPSSGQVLMNGQDITRVPANLRQVNTVFQDYALFPHMNVFDNIAFGLKLKKYSKKDIAYKVQRALDKMQLSEFAHREISEMSGGQQQRVAIARAIVNEPEILLLDEPLSALDLKLRKDMQYELRELQKELGITFVFVTHDQEEALAMSDWIFVMKNGEIMQNGTPTDIYDEPLNHFVADFIGESNIVNGIMRRDYLVEFNGDQFECADAGMNPDEKVEIVIRPEDLEIVDVNQGKIVIKVVSQLFRGVHYEILGQDKKGNEWLIHSTKKAQIGEEIGLTFDVDAIHVMRFGESEADFDLRLESYEE